NVASNMYMDVTGGYTAVGDGVNIQQYTSTGTTNQQFNFTHLGDGTYKVLAIHSKKSVDVTNGSKVDGANVQQWTYYGLPSQQFIVLPGATDGSYNLIGKHSGKIVESINTFSEGNVRQWTNTNQTRGQWKLVQVQQLANGTGNGLNAQYYNGMNFETLRRTAIDTTINFNWTGNAPNAYVGVDNFSVRWSGQIQPRTTGTYTFFINSDNGRRLWINDQLVIDKWISDYGIEYTGTISLNANQRYNIKLEYFEDLGGASCMLEWMSPMQPREVVPKSQLYSTVSAVDETKADSGELSIYPVPVTNKTMHVQLSGFDNNENAMLVMYDLVGKPMLRTKLDNSGKIDLTGVSPGTYIVSVHNVGHVANKRIVVL
ncbi:MAG TPA: RICIN domain-containing protein, partial [Paludibacter sp.]|nr:RICIN domain-containing protein [Paludibacter sp.]